MASCFLCGEIFTELKETRSENCTQCWQCGLPRSIRDGGQDYLVHVASCLLSDHVGAAQFPHASLEVKEFYESGEAKDLIKKYLPKDVEPPIFPDWKYVYEGGFELVIDDTKGLAFSFRPQLSKNRFWVTAAHVCPDKKQFNAHLGGKDVICKRWFLMRHLDFLVFEVCEWNGEESNQIDILEETISDPIGRSTQGSVAFKVYGSYMPGQSGKLLRDQDSRFLMLFARSGDGVGVALGVETLLLLGAELGKLGPATITRKEYLRSEDLLVQATVNRALTGLWRLAAYIQSIRLRHDGAVLQFLRKLGPVRKLCRDLVHPLLTRCILAACLSNVNEIVEKSENLACEVATAMFDLQTKDEVERKVDLRDVVNGWCEKLRWDGSRVRGRDEFLPADEFDILSIVEYARKAENESDLIAVMTVLFCSEVFTTTENPTGCWNSYRSARIEDNTMQPSSLQNAYKAIGLVVEKQPDASFKERNGMLHFWPHSYIPLSFHPFWRPVKDSIDNKKNKRVVCHHPLLCELSRFKKMVSGVSHTCCRPSHIVVVDSAFNSMNTGMQMQFHHHHRVGEKTSLEERKRKAQAFGISIEHDSHADAAVSSGNVDGEVRDVGDNGGGVDHDAGNADDDAEMPRDDSVPKLIQ